VTDDKTKDILGELHEAHTQPSSPETEPVPAAAAQPEEPAYFAAFEERIIKRVVKEIEVIEGKFADHVGNELRRFSDELVLSRSDFKAANNRLKNALMELQDMIAKGNTDAALRDEIVEWLEEGRHKFLGREPHLESENGGP
jgi:hypothetical protein